MILDAREIPAGTLLHTDLCIVGAGAAGITLALALEDSGLDVIVLESGGDDAEPQTQQLYAGTVADTRLHPPADNYRVRRFGGSTTLWGGRCMPLDALDFKAREHIAHSGWPITLDDLLPFYPQANALCEAGDFTYTTREFAQTLPPMIGGLAHERFTTDTLERFSCPTDFGSRYRARLTNGRVRVLQHANLGTLPMQDGCTRRVGNAVVRVLGGATFGVAARAYVLATGGLEVPRLLLNSPGPSGRGLGNAHDVVGRYYMSHLAGTIGTIDLAAASSVWHGYDVSEEGIYCRRRLALREQAQRALGAGNFIARLHHPRIPDAGHGNGILSALYLARFIVPYEYAKRLYDGTPDGYAGSTLAHLKNVISDAPGTAQFLWHWLRKRTLADRKFPSVIVRPANLRFSLDFHAEQEPNPASRVTLGNDTDALGQRRIHIDWRYTQQDVATVSRALEALAQEIGRSGVGRFIYDPNEVEAEMTRYGAYGGHHIGTARMGADPRTSVVDANCRLHEVDNVYIASAAVFPTSGQANPTLSIVALALRLAAHLRGAANPGVQTGTRFAAPTACPATSLSESV
ncbi:choline dehydrogenase-like flavoprotein [Paraburkholderia eburnea]|uniref:Choline dehydrogenase-like flavoprotein n=1 Tax=Paraburkholderia eburnea TaxID=1189126 RepID=A0A2S4M726_9BURK|nr:GMC family oxidoreductase [Paraburkholderia eburnea]POR50524.1 choline dehydrogenase-like flavoprotein [Paraburkholderia eburnea]PRZ21292.1 choline dehydrogenase-like flavoprotein [Paraburkholderia eburnea]